MAIVSFDKDTVIDYIPSYGGNRESDDPCIVRLKFVPYSRVQHYSRVIAARTKGISNPSKVAEISQGVQRKQFVESVDSIAGYFIDDREVVEADEFYDTADTDLILEVIQAMESQSKLSEGQVKNSSRVSDTRTSTPTEAPSDVQIAPMPTRVPVTAKTSEG